MTKSHAGAVKRATSSQDSVALFIRAALVEQAKRYEVARHIVRRTYSAYERLPLGAIVLHPDRGCGTIVEVLPDLRRVVRSDKGGAVHHYSPQELHIRHVDRYVAVLVASQLATPASSGGERRLRPALRTWGEPSSPSARSQRLRCRRQSACTPTSPTLRSGALCSTPRYKLMLHVDEQPKPAARVSSPGGNCLARSSPGGSSPAPLPLSPDVPSWTSSCLSSCRTSISSSTAVGSPTDAAAAEDLVRGGVAASWDALPLIRAGEAAALQYLEQGEMSIAAELNALRSLPSQALRQRSVVRQRSLQSSGQARLLAPSRPQGKRPRHWAPNHCLEGCQRWLRRSHCPLAMQAARHRTDQCAPSY